MGASVLLAAAAALDGLLCTGSFVDHPLTLLLAAAVGCALGAWTRPRTAAASVLIVAVFLTVANQRHFPGDYAVADDLAFFLIVLGAPAILGTILVARAAQVRELTALSRRLDAQRADTVAAARLEEQHRIELAVHHRLVELMGAVALRAQGALREPAGPHGTALREIEETARSGLTELREALGVLREGAEGTDAGTADPAPRAAPDGPAGVAPPRPSPGHPDHPDHPDRPDVLLAAALGTALAVESVVRAATPGPAWLNVIAAFVVVAPLLHRRSRPLRSAGLVSLLAAAVSTTLVPVSGTVTGIGLLLVTAYSVGARTTGRRLACGVALVLVGILVIALATPSDARDPEGVVPSLVWASLALGAGTLAAGWQRRADRVRQLVTDLERLRDADVRVAVARQRADAARDLHDSVAHTLTVVCLNAGAAAQSPELTGEESLTTIAEVARAGMDELRSGLAPLEPPDLLAAPILREVARRLDVDLRLQLPDPEVWSPDDATLVHRVLREAIVNAARHAPGSQVRASITLADDELRIEVVDDGSTRPHLTPEAGVLGTGTGLSGLAGLVEERGGSMEFGRRPERGFQVVASVPRSSAPVPA